MKHGMHNTKTYHAWESMKARCLNPNNAAYAHYGGRGIGVCVKWLDFLGFFADMGVSPEGMTLERIDNNRGYEKSNCKWASRTEQQGNRRNSVVLVFDGRSQVIEQWAKEYGLGSGLVHNRVFQLGWPIEKALTVAPRKMKRRAEWQTAQQI